ncbi:hypothetical protein FHR61_002735 [Xanthomonas arboricola]|uniref:Uncharacterized protein n=1 Tax=Xanthomonas cannabis TaxID=1885674 RepID=A0ABR6JNC1_9XANT|nr:hypothetical protein [Xanthomonas cannabis]MBB5522880.1 hypothetical protein [Xanthomonas cannabis]
MVNGDIDNCDVARRAAVETITPLRLGLPLWSNVEQRVCAKHRSNQPRTRWHGRLSQRQLLCTVHGMPCTAARQCMPVSGIMHTRHCRGVLRRVE